MARDLTPPDPSVVLDLLSAYRKSKVMFAAVSLGVFDALAAGPKPADALAKELGCDADALARLLDACVMVGLLTRSHQKYANTPAAASLPDAGQPAADARVRELHRRGAVEDVGPPGRRGPRGDAPLEAGLRLGRPDLRTLLQDRGEEARVPLRHARLRAGRARRRWSARWTWGGTRRSWTWAGRRAPRGGGVPALAGPAGGGVRPAGGGAAGEEVPGRPRSRTG